jgi:signal transduction histidine kinase
VTPELNERQALEDRVLQQATISRLSRFVLSGAAEEQILDEAVRAVAEALHVELAKYLELSPRQDAFVLRAAVGWPKGLVGTATIPAGGHRSYAGYVISEGHPVSVQDMSTETRFTPTPLLVERGVASGLSVVVYGDHGTLGVLGGHSRTERHFTEDEADFLQTIANVVSAGVLRRRGEEEVAARTTELANSNKELEAFSYSVSHDLRAPLRAIHGFSKILLEDYAECLDDEGRRVLGIICANTEKMGQLIDDILAFSRLGRHDLQSSMVDMDGLVRSVADELMELEQGREVRIHIEPLPEAFGDLALLRQVWANLVSNALKFTAPKPRADITIDCDERAEDILYRIRDNGAGFDMRYAETLFGVFRRLHGHEFPGTGIGLAIVKRIITRHGGTVGAEGRENEGACFTFTLPHPPQGDDS